MSQLMRDIRFPFSGRGKGQEPAPGAGRDPLAGMAEQIRELDRAAEQVAARIGEESQRLREGAIATGSATRTDLLAGLGSALVDRTEAIRDDCRKLSELMERTARLIAERDAHDPVVDPTPAPEPQPAPRVADVPPIDIAPIEIPPISIPGDDLYVPADPAASSEVAADEELVERRSDLSDRRQPAVVSEGVRLIATQMAIAGSSRTEIERRLRSQFGVRDADLALDDIFGTRETEAR